MVFEFECPHCNHKITVTHEELAHTGEVKCSKCGDMPRPDIMTAYQHVGKSLSDLYNCCSKEDDQNWLPKNQK